MLVDVIEKYACKNITLMSAFIHVFIMTATNKNVNWVRINASIVDVMQNYWLHYGYDNKKLNELEVNLLFIMEFELMNLNFLKVVP